ncbi:MAG: M23 family metallopeptidase [Candidatus Bathyarchaeia archaeon]
MIPAARSEGVSIYCPEDGRISFFNSPYFAHRNYTGIDIYPNLKFGDEAPSPVSGEVVEIRHLGFFPNRGFGFSSQDYAIILRSRENEGRFIKMLHVKPNVEIGDRVRVGDGIGYLLRSGFFDFWTDPHIHVEVRDPSDPLRARGGYRISRLINVDVNCTDIMDLKGLSGIVVESRREYSLVALNCCLEHGIPAHLDEGVGIIDGGVPHYGFFGIHASRTPKIGERVRFLGREIGSVVSVYEGMGLAKIHENVVFRLNGKPVRLSLYLFPSTPIVKVIPEKPGDLPLKRHKEVKLTLA